MAGSHEDAVTVRSGGVIVAADWRAGSMSALALYFMAGAAGVCALPAPAAGPLAPQALWPQRHLATLAEALQASMNASEEAVARKLQRVHRAARCGPSGAAVSGDAADSGGASDTLPQPLHRIVCSLITFLQSRAALVRRDAPADDLTKNAAEIQKTFSEQLNKLVQSQSAQDAQKALKEGSDSLVQQLSAFAASLQGAVADASGKVKESLEQSRANIERTAEELRRAHPEVQQQADAFKDKLQLAVSNGLQEAEKLSKEVAANVEQTNQKLQPQVQQAYNAFLKQAQDLQKKIHDAANKQ